MYYAVGQPFRLIQYCLSIFTFSLNIIGDLLEQNLLEISRTNIEFSSRLNSIIKFEINIFQFTKPAITNSYLFCKLRYWESDFNLATITEML